MFNLDLLLQDYTYRLELKTRHIVAKMCCRLTNGHILCTGQEGLNIPFCYCSTLFMYVQAWLLYLCRTLFVGIYAILCEWQMWFFI